MELNEALGAVIAALISALVSIFVTRRTIRTEVSKLKLGLHQKLLELLVIERIKVYPELYRLLSELSKVAVGQSASYESLPKLLEKVNDWDSKHSIFFSRETANACWEFQKQLRFFAAKFPNLQKGTKLDLATKKELVKGLIKPAERLELAMKSDLGIHGVEMNGKDNDNFDFQKLDAY